jgi:hypothetical protein
MKWVNVCFTLLVDHHKRKEAKLKRERILEQNGCDLWVGSRNGEGKLTNSQEVITPETVNYLLKLSAKIDSSIEIFLMLVELVLLNKLGLRIEGVLRSLKPLSRKSKEKLFGLLKKYKYKLAPSDE